MDTNSERNGEKQTKRLHTTVKGGRPLPNPDINETEFVRNAKYELGSSVQSVAPRVLKHHAAIQTAKIRPSAIGFIDFVRQEAVCNL